MAKKLQTKKQKAKSTKIKYTKKNLHKGIDCSTTKNDKKKTKYHISIYVDIISEEFRTLALEQKEKNKDIKFIYGNMYTPGTKKQIEILDKFYGKNISIKDDNELYEEILKLGRKKHYLENNLHNSKFTAKKWNRENKYVENRIFEILDSLI